MTKNIIEGFTKNLASDLAMKVFSKLEEHTAQQAILGIFLLKVKNHSQVEKLLKDCKANKFDKD